MNGVRSNSLRRRLFIRLVGILSAIWTIATAVVLWSAWRQAHEAYANQAVDLAVTMADAFGRTDDPVASREHLRDAPVSEGDNNFFVVVRKGREEIYRSANAPLQTPIAARADTQIESKGVSWTLVSYASNDGLVTTTVGLVRAEATLWSIEAAAGIALPLLIGLGCVILAVISAIRQGLDPVDRLRRQILARSPQQLKPIVIEGPPEELQPMIDSINNLFERLAAALETERRFIADASHELRTPLTAIKAQIQTVNQQCLSPEAAAAIEKIHRGVDRAARLVEQLLTLARTEAISAAPTVEEIDLNDVAGSQVSELFPQAVSAGVEIEYSGARAPVHGNVTETAILVRNLVDNAIRYSGTGAVVRIATGSDPYSSWLRVEDSGPGMTGDDLAQAFARFKRGSRAAGEGSGLGLSIVRAIAERRGGEVHLSRSAALGGCAVSVEFPRRTCVSLYRPRERFNASPT